METCKIIHFAHFAELKHLHVSLCEVSGCASLWMAVEMKRTSAVKLTFTVVQEAFFLMFDHVGFPSF